MRSATLIGEIGLDFACDVDHKVQERVFREQLSIAQRWQKPVVLHCVRAFEPMMKILGEYRLAAVIFHGFIGSRQQAERAVARGYYLSFGEVSFHSPRTVEAMKSMPIDHLFAETDESDVAIESIYQRIAHERGISMEELQEKIEANYNKIFYNTMTDNWLERTTLLLGEEKLEQLRHAHVLVVGLGGVGAYAAEMIARAGVGRMTIADADTVSATNINRQLIALHSTIGREKSDLMAERLRDINPDIELTVINRFIKDDETDSLLDSARFDFVVDAIDTLSPKLALIKGALDRGIPLVSSMGAGAKTDPTKMEICDISRTHHCPLAHMLRKRLHKIGIRKGFHAVFSPEPVREGAMILCEEQNKKSNTGTISYIPALFGIGCASVVVRSLIGEF